MHSLIQRDSLLQLHDFKVNSVLRRVLRVGRFHRTGGEVVESMGVGHVTHGAGNRFFLGLSAWAPQLEGGSQV